MARARPLTPRRWQCQTRKDSCADQGALSVPGRRVLCPRRPFFLRSTRPSPHPAQAVVHGSARAPTHNTRTAHGPCSCSRPCSPRLTPMLAPWSSFFFPTPSHYSPYFGLPCSAVTYLTPCFWSPLPANPTRAVVSSRCPWRLTGTHALAIPTQTPGPVAVHEYE